MNSFQRLGFTAFLDLVCCGFGAATLLFLLSVTSIPEIETDAQDETLVVVYSHAGGARAEIGMEYLLPGESEWIRVSSNPGMEQFAALSSRDSGGEAFLIVFKPRKGTWRVRPYLVDFPHGALAPSTVQPAVYGRHKPAIEPRESVLRHCGEHGAVLEISIEN